MPTLRDGSDMPLACVGMGSNERPQHYVTRALQLLSERFGPCTHSTIWASAPLDGGEDESMYHNLAVTFPTTLSWDVLRTELRTLEARCDRRREPDARVTIDLDRLLLLDGARTVLADELDPCRLVQLPHVLAPLAELLPDWVHPQTGTTLAAIARRAKHLIDGMTVVQARTVPPGDDKP